MLSYRSEDSVGTLSGAAADVYAGIGGAQPGCSERWPVSDPSDAASQPDACLRTAWHCVVNVFKGAPELASAALTSWQGSASMHSRGAVLAGQRLDMERRHLY